MRILHTMLRVGDLKRSVDFYTHVLGMKLLRTTDRPDQKYTLAFVGYGDEREQAGWNSLTTAAARRRMRAGLDLPEWYSFPEVLEQVKKSYLPRSRQGVTVFFTGLSGSAGKSAVANALVAKLRETGSRSITLLDGDIVRKNLSSELGFSREHRDLNILRIGFVATEITKHGGVAICAPTAPYAATRRKVREAVEAVGGFLEVFVSTPLEECERRDRKGLYARARAGLIKGIIVLLV